MKIIFETEDEWENFDKNTCPIDLGCSRYECDMGCEECYENAGVKLIKEYEEKSDKDYNYEECINFIGERCNISGIDIQTVLELELDYMKSIGIAYEL